MGVLIYYRSDGYILIERSVNVYLLIGLIFFLVQSLAAEGIKGLTNTFKTKTIFFSRLLHRAVEQNFIEKSLHSEIFLLYRFLSSNVLGSY